MDEATKQEDTLFKQTRTIWCPDIQVPFLDSNRKNQVQVPEVPFYF